MGIYDGKKDVTLSDVFKRTFSPDPVVISADIEVPSEFLEQVKRETEASDDIKQKFWDVCMYMNSHKLALMVGELSNGVKFSLKMEVAADGKRDNM